LSFAFDLVSPVAPSASSPENASSSLAPRAPRITAFAVNSSGANAGDQSAVTFSSW
jgi:hypothetical protein